MSHFILAIFSFLSLAPAAFAEGNTGTPLVNPLGAGTSIPTLLGSIMDFVVKIGSIIVIFMLVYVGYKFVIARGEPGKISEARQALLWTVIGALILLGAKAISIGICETTKALAPGGSITSCVF